MPIGLITDMDSARREDLLDLIADVSPDETPLMTLFGTSSAKGTLHEWLKDDVSRPTTVQADIEGADTSFDDLVQPTREYNFTHIIKKGIKVSRTERRVDVAGMSDPMAYQKAKRLRQLKMEMELAILNSTGASGSSGVARGMRGIDEFTTSVVTARSSGTSFSEQELEDMGADAYLAVSSDSIFDMVLCTVKIKQAIAGFAGNSVRYERADSRRLTKDILVYESSVGPHRIMHHRDVRNTAGSTTVYGLREGLHKVAYLDKPMYEELAKTGDGDKGHWVTEFTIEVQNEEANVKRTGYNQNG